MKPLIKYTILTGSFLVFLLPQKMANSCGFMVYPGEYRFWLLQPDIINEQDLTPFYFAASYLYNGDQNAAVQTYQQKNVDEWYSEISESASKNEIDTILNYTEPSTFFNELQYLSRTNSFMRCLQQAGNKELLNYLLLSKKLEQVAANPDPWEETSFLTINSDELVTEAKKLYRTSTSPFIKLRAAYQLLRIYDLSQQSELVNHTYDNLIAPVKTTSWIKTAALYRKAIHNDNTERNYLLSRVFDIGGYNRTMCLVRFASDKTDSTLPLAKSAHERNVIMAMKLFNSSGRCLDEIKQLYHDEPGYKELPFLLLREINKVEDWLVTVKVTDFGMPAVYNDGYLDNWSYPDKANENYRNDQQYARQLSAFLSKIISDHHQPSQPLIHLLAAHLSMLLNNYTAAVEHLSIAEKAPRLQQNVRTQIAINQFLVHLQLSGMNAATEKEFMKIINTSDETTGLYDPGIMRDQLILYTGRKMIAKGQRARGLMLLSRTQRALGETLYGYKNVYHVIEEKATASDYDEMIAILNSKRKTVFEKFISKNKFASPTNYSYSSDEELNWERNKLLDMKSSYFLRQHDLESARSTLSQIPNSYFKEEPYAYFMHTNPFYLDLYEPHTDDDKVFSKKQVVNEMLRLEALADSSPRKRSEAYLQLGNAWFNMSWHGKNWLMVRQWWTVNESNNWRGSIVRSEFFDDYYGCQQAKAYYLKALFSSNDKQIKTFCGYMVARCDKFFQQYKWTAANRDRDFEDYPGKMKTYKELGFKSIDKKYYNDLIEECELYNSFIKRYNRKLF